MKVVVAAMIALIMALVSVAISPSFDKDAKAFADSVGADSTYSANANVPTGVYYSRYYLIGQQTGALYYATCASGTQLSSGLIPNGYYMSPAAVTEKMHPMSFKVSGNLNAAATRAYWNGYPNDASGVIAKYFSDLTPDERAGATTLAIWDLQGVYYNKKVMLSKTVTGNTKTNALYKWLKGQSGSGIAESLATPPSTFVCVLFHDSSSWTTSEAFSYKRKYQDVVTPTLNVPFTKLWSNDDPANRPSQVTVHLYMVQNGNRIDTGKEITVSAATGWSGSFDKLPMFDKDGNRMQYTVQEIGTPSGYNVGELQGDMYSGFTLTNSGTTPKPSKIDVTVNKLDATTHSQLAGAVLQIQDMNGKVVYGPFTTTTSPTKVQLDAGTYDLVEVSAPAGFTIAESVRFTVSEGTSSSSLPTRVYGYTQSNDVNYAKDDAGKVYPAYCLSLNMPSPSNGTSYTGNSLTSFAGALESNAYYSNKAQTQAAIMRVVGAGYPNNSDGIQQAAGLSGRDADFAAATQYAVNYFTDYNSGRNGSSYGRLIDSGKIVDDQAISQAVKLLIAKGKSGDAIPANMSGKVYFSNSNVQPIFVPDYSGSSKPVEVTMEDTKVRTTQVTVYKTWSDNNNQDGARPQSITVQLYADGVKQGEPFTISEKNGWRETITGLPFYGSTGKAIAYSISEVAPSGYSYTYKASQGAMGEFYITLNNTYAPQTIKVKATKEWNDANNQDGLRTPVTLHLNKTVDGKTVEVANQQRVIAKDATGDALTVTWDNLPKYENGKEITYTVTEDGVAGYTTEINADAAAAGFAYTYKVVNTHAPETTKIKFKKTWNDAENQDGNRPESITVKLLKNGQPTGETFTVTKDTQVDGTAWAGSFENLPKYEGGRLITWSIAEVVPAGYTGAITYINEETNDSVVSYEMTNSYAPGKVSIPVAKVWNDANNQDGVRPASITVHLYADGKDTGKSAALSDDNNWNYTFGNLPQRSGGKDIVYTVVEDAVTNYTTEISGDAATGFTVTNTHAPEITKVGVEKNWDDANNQDGTRPGSVTIHLLADGVDTGKSLVVSAETVVDDIAWRGVFDNLPKYKDGKVITYTVSEDVPEGYTPATKQVEIAGGTGFCITNKHVPETTRVVFEKNWNDSDNQDNIRPESVTVRLFADGVDTGKTFVVSAETKIENVAWRGSFDDLPKMKDGKTIVYTVREDVPAGYTATIKQVENFDNATAYCITNNHTPEVVEVPVHKTWDDADNQDGMRTSEVTVRLMADGEEVASAVLTENNGWSHTFTNLPKYKDGKEIAYTITEDAVEGYETTYDLDGMTKDIINTHVPEVTEFEATKTWNDADNQDGLRTAVTFHLNKTVDGATTVVEGQDKVIAADATGAALTVKWTNLPTKENGKDVTYSVTEDAVAQYTTEINGGSVVNTHAPETTEVPVTKKWEDANNQDGQRPANVTVHLYANGVDTGKTVTLSEENNWSDKFTDLPAKEAGVAIDYTVVEDTPAGYSVVVSGDAAAGFTVTNNYTPEKTNVPVTKTWNDADNQDGLRTESVTIALLADGEPTGQTIELNAENNWKGSFDNLDRYADGKEIAYTVEETAVAQYTTEVTGTASGYTVINTRKPETTKVPVVKDWQDANNQDGVRPAEVTVRLLADGNDTGKSLKLTAEKGWKGEFTDLPKFADGKEIAYTVTEDKVENYTTTIDGTTITNTYKPATTRVTVGKKWEDGENADNTRPASVTVNLLANGQPTGKSVELNADNKWNASFEDLPKFENGQEIAYTVQENTVNNYIPLVSGTQDDGFTITNKLEKKDVIVSKQDLAGKEIAGAVLTITNNDTNETVEEWTSVAGESHQVKLQPGTYTLTETTQPYGFEKAESITFTVTDEYKVVVDGADAGNTVVMKDEWTPTTAKPEAHKTLEGKDLQDGQFTFELKDSAGNTIQTKTNDGNGNVAFDELSFDKPGTYTFTITETAGEEGGIVYDATSYTATVTVKTNDTTDALEATIDYGPAGAANFVNKYETAPVKEHLEATKKLEGKDLTDAEFTFQVIDESGAVVATATNDDQGKVVFPEVTYTKRGVYNYTIVEVAGNEAGITYDTNTIQAHVVVMDNGDGTLKTSVSYGPQHITMDEDGNLASSITVEGTNAPTEFVNKYQPGSTSANLIAYKQMDNGTVEDGKFTFELRNEAGEVIQTKANTTGGTITFDAINYDKAGTYTYTITEVNGGDENIVYATNTVKATVTVTDNNGQLEAVVEYEGNEQVFKNLEKKTVKVSKQDINGTEELPGATLSIVRGEDAEGTDVVATWTSTTEQREVKLEPGTYTLVETTAPNGYKVTESITFTVTDDYKVVVNGSEAEGNVVVMKDKPEDSEVEKYVNKNVHAELPAFDTQFTYDIMGYVSGDATSAQITDSLNSMLAYASAAEDVQVVDMGTDNNHEPNGTVAAAGTTVDNAEVSIEGANLTVKIADAKALRGHWVKVTFDAKIKDEFRTLEAIQGAYQNIDKNDPVKTAEVHTGIPNTAALTLTFDHRPDFSDETNTVTVKPGTTELTVNKVWKNANGQAIDWPEGGTAHVELIAKGGVYGDGKVIDTVTLTADKPNHTFTGLAKLEGVTYSVNEGAIDVAGKHYLPTITTNSDGSVTVANQEEDTQIEKYVNKDVHADLEAFDSEYTYDVMAYISNDADKAYIKDTLVDGIQFVSAANQVTLVDMGTTNDHKANGTVAQDGTALTNFNATIEGQTLAVTIDDAKDLRGHWVKMTFAAKLNNDIINTANTYEQNKQAVANNGLVISPIATHEGVPNKASYTVTASNGAEYGDETNTVTVTPKTTEVSVNKEWYDEGGQAIEWPKDGTAVANVIAKGGKYGNGQVVDTFTLDAGNPSHTFTGLAILEGVTYSVEEGAITVAGKNYLPEVVDNGNGTFTFKNKAEESKIEKYVNKDVHADLEGFDKTFTYDVMAYVTKDADSTKITDTLNDVLEFTTAAADVKVVDMGIENDHLNTVKNDGIAVAGAKATIDGQNLTVEIADSKSLRGHWVKVTFDAQIKESVRTKAAVEAAYGTITNNDPVLIDKVHTGVPNTAAYTITVGNESKYENESNTVTVKPNTTEVTVTKKWTNASNEETTWPEGAKVDVDLIAKGGEYGEAGTVLETVTLSAEAPTHTWDALPQLDGVTYGVDEKAFKVGDQDYLPTIKNNGDGTFTITNAPETPEIEKYVNKDVHSDLGNFETQFTYDVMAYITKDADSAEITDDLNEALEFVSAAGDVKVVDMGTDNNHLSTVAEAGTEVSGAVAAINGKNLTVTIADAKALRGHWVKVTFDAQLTAEYRSLDKIESLYRSIADNSPVQISKEHTGIPNTAAYTINVGNEGKYKDTSNTVTVKPETTNVPVKKAWAAGEAPAGVTAVAHLYADGNDTGKTVTLSADNKWTATFEGVAKFQSDNKTEIEYTVVEDAPTGYTPVYTKEENGTLVITNEKSQIEKYVNKNVHQDLTGLDQVFTYDVMAYVTTDANKTTITDELNEAIEFASAEGEVTVVDMGATNNHVDNVAANGTPVAGANVKIDGKNLTVTIDDSKALRGHWIKVTFNAKFSAETIKTYQDLANRGELVETNGTVKIDKVHTGVPNTSKYVIETENGGTYDNESNTVTVFTTGLTVEKKWAAGEAPAGVTAVAHLFADGVDTGKSIQLNAGNNWTASFDGLPKHKEDGKTEIVYTVVEDTVDGYAPVYTKDENGTLVITNEKAEIEKYVNKAVHQELANFDDTFTYDVMAYITSDADKATITDDLNEVLEFVSTAGDVKVVDMGTDNDHKDTVKGEGSEVAGATVAINGANLTVNIDDARALRGHWVKVTFDAKIKAEYKTVQSIVDKYQTVNVNDPVKITEVHTGVPNTAAYTITVGNEGKYNDTSNTVTIKPNLVEISKVNAAGEELEGAHIVVKDMEGNEVDNWTSTKEVHVVKNIKPGTYTLTEDAAPAGYDLVTEITFTVDDKGIVTTVDAKANKPGTVKHEGNKITVVDELKTTDVEIDKTDAAGEELEGAKITVKDEQGKQVDNWTSTKETHVVKNLKPGTYTLTEDAAPAGYDLITEITFTVNDKGEVETVDAKSNKEGTVKHEGNKITVVDELKKTDVEISKVNAAGEELEGAKITVKDEQGKQVDSWTSGKETHVVKGITAGTYTLTEDAAPAGYDLVTEITFTVDADGKVTTVDAKANKPGTIKHEGNKITVVDELKTTDVEIDKTDAAGEELEGAKITVKDEQGKQVDSWTSGKETHIVKGIKAGTYTLTEDAAPAGYDLITEITFTVDEDGKVTTVDAKANKEGTIKHEGNKITIVDELLPNTVEIDKTDAEGKELEGAKITVKDSEGKQVDSWTSGKETHVIKNIKPGTYTLVEDAAPAGYELITEITFTVNDKGEVTTVDAKSNKEGTVKHEGNKITIVDELKPDTPEIEKYVNKDVHVDLGAFDETFTYDVMAFITNDADNASIYDTLSDSLVFENGEDTDVDVVDMGTENNHKDTVKNAGTPIGGINIRIEGKDLTVNIPDATSLRGHWVKVTFNAKLNPELIKTVQDAANASTEITDNAPVLFDKTHVGIPNTARYVIETFNKSRYEDESNTVTVKPNLVEISKVNVAGEELEGAKITVKDEQGKEVDSWTSTKETHVIKNLKPGTYTLTEDVAPIGYDLITEVTFTVDAKGVVTTVDAKANQEGTIKQEGNHLIIVDKLTPDTPEVEKYVNKDVHADVEFDETFTYDIMAFVTKDADNLYITDTLSANLELVDADNIKVVAVAENNHKTDGAFTSKNADASVAAAGTPVENAEVHVMGGPIATDGTVGGGPIIDVTIADAKALRGQWVKVTFTAKVKADADNVTVVAADKNSPYGFERTEPNTGNAPVASDKDHTGVPNTANYTIGVGNNSSAYSDTSNTVTVKPKPETPEIEKYVNANIHQDLAAFDETFTYDVMAYVTKDADSATVTDDLNEVLEFATEADAVKVVDMGTDNNHNNTVKGEGSAVAGAVAAIDGQNLTVKIDDAKALRGHWVKVTFDAKIKAEYKTVEAIADKFETVDKNDPVKIDGKHTGVPNKAAYTITVNNEGKYTDESNTVTIKPNLVQISKVDSAGEELEGAKITVKDSQGKEVDSWTSTKETHIIKNIKPGTYTLTEDVAPLGYDLITEVTFTVDEKGVVTTVDAKANKPGTITQEGNHLIIVDLLTPVDVKVEKKWAEGDAPADVKVIAHLFADGKDAGKTVELNAGNDWKATFEGLTKYQKGTANEIDYTVVEEEIAGYTPEYTKSEDGTLVITNTPDKHDVEISKVDINGTEELVGANLTVTKKGTDTVVDTWTSGTETHKVKVAAGEYTLTETTAPEGYKVSESIDFKVDANGKVESAALVDNKVQMKDAPKPPEEHEVKISKTTVIGQPELAGAQMTLTNKDTGAQVDKWTSANEPREVTVPAGNYVLHEDVAPLGYDLAQDIEFTVAENGDVTVDADHIHDGMIVMEDKVTPHEIEISKIDATEGKADELAGAELKLTTATGTLVDQWKSGSETHKVKVQPGEYVLHEDAAPAGYDLAQDIKFTVDKNGKVTGDSVREGKVVLENKKTTFQVPVSKIDITNGAVELPGAKLTINKADGYAVTSWTSGTTPHVVEGLLPGTYYLHEDAAPAGYDLAQDIYFVVNADGTITTDSENVRQGRIVMNDRVTTHEVKISKQAINGTNELPGATLVVTNKDTGVEVQKWISTTTQKQIQLPAGNYTLTEITAPEGYDIAESIDFAVDDKGVVISRSQDANGVIVMKDKPSSHEVQITKVDASNAQEIPGAKITLFDSEGTLVTSWTSTTEAHKVTLQPGKYVMHEDETPVGYDFAQDIEFTVHMDGTVESTSYNEGKIVMEDKPKEYDVEVSKIDINGTEELPGAELTITNNATGAVVANWTSTTETRHVTLGKGDYTLTEVTAPEGYKVAESIVFHIAVDGTLTSDTTDAVTGAKLTMKDAPKPPESKDVKISKRAVSGADELPGAVLTVTNDATGEVADTWTSATAPRTVTLMPGSYTLHEDAAPAGYDLAQDIKFTLAADGTVTSDVLEGTNTIVMTDRKTTHDVKISKQAINTTEELPGATLTVTDSEGQKVAEWVSTNEQRQITLAAGTYTLTETTAPEGFLRAEDITFTVKEDGTVDSPAYTNGAVVMKDDYQPHDVKVSKVDATDGATEIAGAYLTVTDKATNQVVEAWTSEQGVTHEFQLKPGSYTLHEDVAPAGYDLAQDIDFTVNADGTVTSSNLHDGKIVMEDKKAYQEVLISKMDITNGAELAGAALKVTNDATGEVVDQWTSNGTVHKLAVFPGSYTLTEDQAPLGYAIAEAVQFSIDEQGRIISEGYENGRVVMKDARTGEVTISKQAVNGTGELPGATLTVTNRETGEMVEQWVSGNAPRTITLLPGSYTLTETTAPNGYLTAESIDFTVANDGTVDNGGNITMLDAPIEKAVISKIDMATKRELPGATLKLSKKIPAGATADDVNTVGAAKAPAPSAEAAPAVSYIDDSTLTEVEVDEATAARSEAETVTSSDEPVSPDDIKTTTATTPASTTATNGAAAETATTTAATEEVVVEEEAAEEAAVTTEETLKEVLTWVSTDRPREFELEEGDYVLEEVAAPAGYALADAIEFHVNKDGSVDGGTVVMEDAPEYTEVQFTKIWDDANNKYNTRPSSVPFQLRYTTDGGATYSNYGEPKNLTGSANADSWVATWDMLPSVIDGKAPQYSVMEVVTTSPYKVSGQGMTLTNTVNAPTAINVAKIDQDGNFVAGATLHIEDVNGTLIGEGKFVTGNAATPVTLPDGSYVLIEDEAPNGYVVANNVDFTVSEGRVVMVNGTQMNADNVTVTMVDRTVESRDISAKKVWDDKNNAFGTRPGSVTFELQSTVDGQNWTAVQQQTFTGDTNEWTAVFSGLPVADQSGREITYAIVEVNVDPHYTASVGANGTIVNTVNGHPVKVSKVDITNGEELPGANLTITSNVNGNEVDNWVSTAAPHDVVLPAGEYTLTEVSAPNGYQKAESIAFRANDDGSIDQYVGGQWVAATDGIVTMMDAPEGYVPPTDEEQPTPPTTTTTTTGDVPTATTTTTTTGSIPGTSAPTTGTTTTSGTTTGTAVATTGDATATLAIALGGVAFAAAGAGLIAHRRRNA